MTYGDLKTLGFSDGEIKVLRILNENNLAVSERNISMVKDASTQNVRSDRVRYANRIFKDEVDVTDKEDLARHARKMAGGRKIGIHNLKTSTVVELDRKGIIFGIPKDTPFSVYNFDTYIKLNEKSHGMVDVLTIGSENVTVKVNKKPLIKKTDKKEVPNIIKLVDFDEKSATLKVNKENIKLCNRHLIMASLKRPEFFTMMCELIAYDGTSVYVYSQSVNAKKNLHYNATTQRVYANEYNLRVLKNKFKQIVNEVATEIGSIFCEVVPATQEFDLFDNESLGINEEDGNDEKVTNGNDTEQE